MVTNGEVFTIRRDTSMDIAVLKQAWRGLSLALLVIVPLVITMIAGARIFFVFTGRTFFEVEIELLDHGLRIGRRLDLDDDGEVVAFGKSGVRDQDVAFFREAHLGGVRATASGDPDCLFADGRSFAVFPYRCDLHLAVFGDKEFEMRFHFVKDLSAVGPSLSVCMCVTMFAFFVFVVFVLGLQRGDADCEGESGRERREGIHRDISFLDHGFWFGFLWMFKVQVPE